MAFTRAEISRRFRERNPGYDVRWMSTNANALEYQREYRASQARKDSANRWAARNFVKNRERILDGKPDDTRRKLLKKYGCTDPDRRLSQERCDICGKVPTKGRGRRGALLHVDHDHSTGKFRGMLCVFCNSMLGYGQDQPAHLRAGAAYLEEHAMSQQNFIWLDLETSGLVPEAKPYTAILEIGLVAVDRTLAEVAHWHSPISPPSGFMGVLAPELVEMHSNSGLLGELRGPRAVLSFEHGGLPNLKQAEDVALQFMAAYAPPLDARGRGQATLAGANPGFDLTWLRVHMPRLAELFSYRVYDTNALWMSSAWLAGQPMVKTGVRHRALDDCRASIDVVRRFFGATVPA